MKQERSDAKKFKAGTISLFIGIFILCLKFLAWKLTGSLALKSDAIESIVNVLAAVIVLYVLRISQKRPDADHPYGHGKVEHFSATFEGTAMCAAALWIFSDAFSSFLHGPKPFVLGLGLLVNFGAGVMNGLLGLFLMKKGREENSQALIADGHHVLSDFYTTVGLAIGLGVAHFTGLSWIDPLIALVVSVLLGWAGARPIYKAGQALLDAEDPELISSLVDQLQKNRPEELIMAHGLRTLRAGHRVHIDVHYVVPEYYEVKMAHDLISDFSKKVLKEIKLEGEFHTHLDPCRKAFCGGCRVKSCPIRLSPFVEEMPFTASQVTMPEINEE